MRSRPSANLSRKDYTISSRIRPAGCCRHRTMRQYDMCDNSRRGCVGRPGEYAPSRVIVTHSEADIQLEDGERNWRSTFRLLLNGVRNGRSEVRLKIRGSYTHAITPRIWPWPWRLGATLALGPPPPAPQTSPDTATSTTHQVLYSIRIVPHGEPARRAPECDPSTDYQERGSFLSPRSFGSV